MRFGFIDNFATQLAMPVSEADTEIELVDTQPLADALNGAERVALTLFVTDEQGNETKREVVHVTSVASPKVTVVRQQEGSAGVYAFAAGDPVEARLTAESLREVGVGWGKVGSGDVMLSAGGKAVSGAGLSDSLALDFVGLEPVDWVDLKTDLGTNPLRRMTFSHNGQYLFIAGGRRDTQYAGLVFDTTTKTRVAQIVDDSNSDPFGGFFTSDDALLVVAYTYGDSVCIYNTTDWTLNTKIDFDYIAANSSLTTTYLAVRGVEFIEDGARMVMALEAGDYYTRSEGTEPVHYLIYSFADGSITAPIISADPAFADEYIYAREVRVVESLNKVVVSNIWSMYPTRFVVFDYDTIDGTWTLNTTIEQALKDAGDDFGSGMGVYIQDDRYAWCQVGQNLGTGVPLYFRIDLVAETVYVDQALKEMDLDYGYDSMAVDPATGYLWIGTESHAVIIDPATTEVAYLLDNATFTLQDGSNPTNGWGFVAPFDDALWVAPRQSKSVYAVSLGWKLGVGKAQLDSLDKIGKANLALGEQAQAGSGGVALGGQANAAEQGVAVGSQAQTTAPGAVAIGAGATASVPGGLQVSALSYAAKAVEQSSAMQTVLLSGEIDLSDTAAVVEVSAPTGTLIMPDAVEFIVTQSGALSYQEQTIAPPGVSNYANLVEISPDETLLAYQEQSGSLMLFNLPDFTAVAGAPTGLSGVRRASFSPDSSMLAVARSHANPGLEVYNTADWSVVSGVPKEALGAYSVCFSPDGKYLAIHYTEESQAIVVVLNVADWSVVTTGIVVNGQAEDVQFSPSSAYLVVTTWHNTAVYRVSDWSSVTLPTGVSDTDKAAFSPDEKYLALTGATSSKDIQVVDTSDWSLVGGLPALTPHSEDSSQAVVFTPDGQYLFVATYFAPGVRVLKTSDWTEVTGMFDLPSAVTDVALNADGSNLYVSVSNYDTSIAPLQMLQLVQGAASISVGNGAAPGYYLSGAQVPAGGPGSRAVLSPQSHGGANSISASIVSPDASGKKVKMAVRGYVMEV